VKAVVMAGGRGARLYPLTQDAPKPLLPIMGRPLIDHTMAYLERQGFRQAIITTGHQCRPLLNHLNGTNYHPCDVICALEEFPLGTAGSVRNAERMLSETFLVMSSDIVTDADLMEAVRAHRQSGALLTMLVSEVSDVSLFGMVVADATGRVVDFREKPRSPDEVVSRLANAGVYVMEPEALGMIPRSRYCDFARDVIRRMLASDRRIHAHRIPGYWCDVGTAQRYRKAHLDVMKGRVRLPGFDVPSAGADGTAPEATLDPSVRISGPVWVGRGASVGAGTQLGPYAFLADGVHVGDGASIAWSVLNQGVVVGASSQVDRSVIGSDTRLPSGSRIRSSVIHGYTTIRIPTTDSEAMVHLSRSAEGMQAAAMT